MTKWTDEKNKRRCELIERAISHELLTPAENDELERLQAELWAYRQEMAPLPLKEARQLYTELKLKDIRHKLTHGVPPLTLEECRWLFLLATGEEIRTRKRCDTCGGDGVRHDMVLAHDEKLGCGDCRGKGYRD